MLPRLKRIKATGFKFAAANANAFMEQWDYSKQTGMIQTLMTALKDWRIRAVEPCELHVV